MVRRDRDIEIEDVLSSIQRLVAGNEPERSAPDMSDRLILDADKRVDAAGEAASSGAPQTEAPAQSADQSASTDPPGDTSGAPLILLDSYRVAGQEQRDEDDLPNLSLRDKVARLSAASERRRAEDAEADGGAGAPADPTPADLAPAADAGRPDDAELRRLVRELVREELQGKLGRQVTRNVRRIVREEVERALGAQDDR